MTHGTDAPVTYSALNTVTSAPVSNDQANHTLKIVTDGVETAYTGSITPLSNGEYAITIPGAQVGIQSTTVTGLSSTSNVRIIPKSFASINFSPNYAYVTAGTSSPAVAGVFTVFGTLNGQPIYTNSTIGAQLSYSGTRWELYIAGSPGSLWFLTGSDANGTYTPSTGATGAPVVAIHGGGGGAGVVINVGNHAGGVVTVGS